MKKLLSYLIVFAIGFAFGGLWGVDHFRDATEMVQNDTTVRFDTIRIVSPAEAIKEKKEDDDKVEVRDTIRIRDTLYMYLQTEKKIYKGKEYYAEVSGYNPSLDVIEVYPRTETITKTYAPPKNLLSAGVETGYLGSYSLSIYLEYERMLQKNFSIYMQTGYNLPAKVWGMTVGGKYHISW